MNKKNKVIYKLIDIIIDYKTNVDIDDDIYKTAIDIIISNLKHNINKDNQAEVIEDNILYEDLFGNPIPNMVLVPIFDYYISKENHDKKLLDSRIHYVRFRGELQPTSIIYTIDNKEYKEINLRHYKTFKKNITKEFIESLK